MRIRLTVSNHFTARDLFTFKHIQVTPLWNELFVLFTIFINDDQTTFTLGFFTEADRTGEFSKNSCILWFTRFEQVSNARQTTGDIASLRRLLRNTSDDVTHRHLSAVFQAHNRAGRQCIGRWNISIREGNFLTLSI